MAASRKIPFTETSPVVTSIRGILTRTVAPGQQLDIAYSGGLDSTVLLHSACMVSAEFGCSIRGVHVNHRLSTNAKNWLEHCQVQCAAWSTILHVHDISVPRSSGLGVEGAARKARYQALEQSTADWILLAHHADDQAETVLLNLFRGAGVRGLGGMLPANGRFLRPLLGLRRSELKQYADNHGLSWIEDESNSDTRYTRNFIRQDLLPNISKRYPAISRQLAGTAERIAEADGLLAQLALIDSKCDTLKFPVPLKILRALEPARSMNLLRYTLLEYKLQTPGQCRMREFIRQLRTASPDKHPELKIGKWVLRSQRQQLHLIEIPVTLDGE